MYQSLAVALTVLLMFVILSLIISSIFTIIVCMFIGFSKWWIVIPITVFITTLLLIITEGK